MRPKKLRPSKRLLAQLAANKHITWRQKRVKAQDGLCFYCQRVMKPPHRTATLDHVIPLSRGGADHWENTVAACEPCNREKGNSLPEQAISVFEPETPQAPDQPWSVVWSRAFPDTDTREG